MHVEIRKANPSDFEQANQVLQEAFERAVSFLPMLRLHHAMEPEGLWVATRNGEIIGTASCVDYGAVAYLGLMAVRPDCQGQGIARRVMSVVLNWIAERGCECTLLDATPRGAPLYERLGFVDDATAYAYFKPADAWTGLHPTPPIAKREGAVEVSAACDGDFAEIVAFDRLAFGANREKLFVALGQVAESRRFVARRADGRLAGYLLVRDPTIGPWAATDPMTADALLAATLPGSFSAPPLVHVPRSNEACRRILAAHGFVEQRRLRHMRRGAPAPGQPAMLFGQSSFGHG